MSDEAVVSTPSDAGSTSAASSTPTNTGASVAPATSTTSNVAPSATGPTSSTQPSATDGGREGWVPSYRVRETREAAIREAQSQFAQERAAAQAELARYKAQVQALTGVTPQPIDQDSQRASQIKDEFFKLFPKFRVLEERFDDFEAALGKTQDYEAQVQHYWQTYGAQQMDRLFDHATKDLGAPLDGEGKRLLHSAFTGFLNSSPELAARYGQDPTLVDEFWKVFSAGFINPARRGAAAATVNRATGAPAIPRDVPGGAPVVSQAPKPANLDERVANAWQQYQQSAKQ